MRVAGGFVLLLVVSVGCSRKPENEQLAALNQMLETGVLTRAEYEAKKAALATIIPASAPSPAPPVPAAANVAPPPASLPPPAPVQSPPPASPSPQPNPPAVTPSSGNFLVLKKVTVMDQNGFDHPIPSATLLLPADWQTQGSTQWNNRDACNTIQTTLRSTGPDGRGYEVFPVYNWTWADDPGPLRLAAQQKAAYGSKPCDIMPPMSAADFIRRSLPRIRPGAQLVAIEPMPKFMQILQQQARQGEQMALQYRLQERIRPDVARARIRYSANGQAVEEWLAATTVATGILGPSMNPRTGQMFQAFTYNCVGTLVAARAPQGQLDASEKFFELITSSIRIDQSWQARVTQVSGNVAAAEQKGVRDRVAINNQTARDLDKIRREGYANQQASEDRVFGNISDTTRGVESFRNPTTGETVELSNLYGRAWVNNRGEYYLTDQTGTDPNQVLKNSNWTALEPVKR